MNCDCCNNAYHLLCSKFNKVVFDAIAKQKCFNQVFWYCDSCRDNVKKILPEVSKLSEQVANLQCRVSKLEISNSLKSSKIPVENFPLLNKGETKVSNAKTHQVLLIPGDQEKLTMAQVCDIAKKKLPNIPIKRLGVTKDGHGFVNVPDKDNCDKALTNLQKDYNVKAKTSEFRDFLPQITITDINGDDYNNDNKAELKTAIINKNPTIKSCTDDKKQFDILFLTENKSNNTIKAVCRIHPDILKAIKHLRYRIFIDFGICRVNDRFFLKQCYRCQKFGHRSEECPMKQSNKYVCRFCSTNHESSTCPVKQSNNKENFKCANCRGNHSSTDNSCPALQKQANYIISRTKGLEDYPKNSIPRHAIVT